MPHNNGDGDSGVNDTADNRPAVVISTRRLDTILPVDDGKRVLCLAGAGLASLKNYVAKNFPGRMSHSTLGSNFLNPTTAAGEYWRVFLGGGGDSVWHTLTNSYACDCSWECCTPS